MVDQLREKRQKLIVVCWIGIEEYELPGPENQRIPEINDKALFKRAMTIISQSIEKKKTFSITSSPNIDTKTKKLQEDDNLQHAPELTTHPEERPLLEPRVYSNNALDLKDVSSSNMSTGDAGVGLGLSDKGSAIISTDRQESEAVDISPVLEFDQNNLIPISHSKSNNVPSDSDLYISGPIIIEQPTIENQSITDLSQQDSNHDDGEQFKDSSNTSIEIEISGDVQNFEVEQVHEDSIDEGEYVEQIFESAEEIFSMQENQLQQLDHQDSAVSQPNNELPGELAPKQDSVEEYKITIQPIFEESLKLEKELKESKDVEESLSKLPE